jgi:hypothetical protein
MLWASSYIFLNLHLFPKRPFHKNIRMSLRVKRKIPEQIPFSKHWKKVEQLNMNIHCRLSCSMY